MRLVIAFTLLFLGFFCASTNCLAQENSANHKPVGKKVGKLAKPVNINIQPGTSLIQALAQEMAPRGLKSSGSLRMLALSKEARINGQRVRVSDLEATNGGHLSIPAGTSWMPTRSTPQSAPASKPKTHSPEEKLVDDQQACESSSRGGVIPEKYKKNPLLYWQDALVGEQARHKETKDKLDAANKAVIKEKTAKETAETARDKAIREKQAAEDRLRSLLTPSLIQSFSRGDFLTKGVLLLGLFWIPIGLFKASRLKFWGQLRLRKGLYSWRQKLGDMDIPKFIAITTDTPEAIQYFVDQLFQLCVDFHGLGVQLTKNQATPVTHREQSCLYRIRKLWANETIRDEFIRQHGDITHDDWNPNHTNQRATSQAA